MPVTLDEIVARTRETIAVNKEATPLELLREQVADAPPPRNFFSAVVNGHGPGGMNVIAEFKRRSPSAGVIREDVDPVDIASRYENAGAVAISCLTNGPYFGGSMEDLAAIRGGTGLPVLRKDFLVDPYQVWEARVAGADAVLLIAELLSEGQLMDMLILAHELGMTSLLEVHDVDNLLRVQPHLGFPHPGYCLLGVNNRNLATMETDPSHVLRMLDLIGEHIDVLVCESGIRTREDLERLCSHGIRRFLIGESLLIHEDPGVALRELLDTPWR